LTVTLSNVKITDLQFWSVVSLMKVKFVDGSVARLITMPFVILITSVPAVSQRTRLIPGPADGGGGVVTATEADALALPPAPVQVNV
jgi:hypothetical protein